MNKLTIKAIKEDLAPPNNWSLEKARKYRKALRSKKFDMYAPIGTMPFRADGADVNKNKSKLPPDSFPFYKFSEDNPTDEEILERARQIYELMGKFNPFSYQNYSSRIRRAIDLDQIERIKSLKRKSEEVLSNVPKKVKTGVRKQRFVLNTNAKTFSFKVDKMMIGYHPLKGSIQSYLQKLQNEQRLRVMKIMRQIDDELVVFMETGTPGKYINAFSLDRVGKFKDFQPDDYKKIFPAIDLPNVEYKKWKRYAANVRKLVREEQELKEELENMYGTFPEVKTEPFVQPEYDSESDDDEIKSSSTLSREDMEEFIKKVKTDVTTFSTLMDVYSITESDLKKDGTLTELGELVQSNCVSKKKDHKYAVKILMYLGGLISVDEVDKDIQTLKDKVLENVKNTDISKFDYKKKPLGCARVLIQIASWITGGTYDNQIDAYNDIKSYKEGKLNGTTEVTQKDNRLMNGTSKPVKMIADSGDLLGVNGVAPLTEYKPTDGYVRFKVGDTNYSYQTDSPVFLYDPEEEANPEEVKSKKFNTLWKQGIKIIEAVVAASTQSFEISENTLFWSNRKLTILNAHNTNSKSGEIEGYDMQWALFTTLMKMKFGWDWKEIVQWNSGAAKISLNGLEKGKTRRFVYYKYIMNLDNNDENDPGISEQTVKDKLGKGTIAWSNDATTDLNKLGGIPMNNNISRLPSTVVKDIRNNDDFNAELWIRNHANNALLKKFYFYSDNFWKNKNQDFVKKYKTIKELLFEKGIDFSSLLEDFGMESTNGTIDGTGRSSFLDYDSMSDQELNELERELDEMTDLEYDSSSANSYDSSSDTDS